MSKELESGQNTQCPTVVSQPSVESDKEKNALERSKYLYEQVNKWIENSDNKVSVSCGIFTGVFDGFHLLICIFKVATFLICVLR